MKWRVERSATGPGWFAIDPSGEDGAYLPTQAQAFRFAHAVAVARLDVARERLTAERDRRGRRGPLAPHLWRWGMDMTKGTK